MEAPPYAPPKKNRTTTVVWVIVGISALCCVCLIAMCGGGYKFFTSVGIPMAECSMNIESLRDGVVGYAQKHDGKLPSAATWKKDIWPYYTKSFESRASSQRKTSPFQPVDQNGAWLCKVSDKDTTAIVYNSDIAGKKLDDLKPDAVFVFEAPSGTPDHEAYTRQDPTKSPDLILGNRRGWLLARATGDTQLLTPDGKETPVRTNSRQNTVQIHTTS